jgi:hypothetical protein
MKRSFWNKKGLFFLTALGFLLSTALTTPLSPAQSQSNLSLESVSIFHQSNLSGITLVIANLASEPAHGVKVVTKVKNETLDTQVINIEANSSTTIKLLLDCSVCHAHERPMPPLFKAEEVVVAFIYEGAKSETSPEQTEVQKPPAGTRFPKKEEKAQTSEVKTTAPPQVEKSKGREKTFWPEAGGWEGEEEQPINWEPLQNFLNRLDKLVGDFLNKLSEIWQALQNQYQQGKDWFSQHLPSWPSSGSTHNPPPLLCVENCHPIDKKYCQNSCHGSGKKLGKEEEKAFKKIKEARETIEKNQGDQETIERLSKIEDLLESAEHAEASEALKAIVENKVLALWQLSYLIKEIKKSKWFDELLEDNLNGEALKNLEEGAQNLKASLVPLLEMEALREIKEINDFLKNLTDRKVWKGRNGLITTEKQIIKELKSARPSSKIKVESVQEFLEELNSVIKMEENLTKEKEKTFKSFQTNKLNKTQFSNLIAGATSEIAKTLKDKKNALKHKEKAIELLKEYLTPKPIDLFQPAIEASILEGAASSISTIKTSIAKVIEKVDANSKLQNGIPSQEEWSRSKKAHSKISSAGSKLQSLKEKLSQWFPKRLQEIFKDYEKLANEIKKIKAKVELAKKLEEAGDNTEKIYQAFSKQGDWADDFLEEEPSPPKEFKWDYFTK